MVKKMLVYGVVGLLAVALVVGTMYILLRPAEVQAGQGPIGGQGQGRVTAVEPGTGYRSGEAVKGGAGAGGRGGVAQGGGVAGNGGGAQGGGVAGNGGGANGRSQGGNGGGRADAVPAGDGVGLDHPADTWIAVSGTVVAFDDDLTVQTAEGEMVFETGPDWYWDANGIALEAGDEVVLQGFYDGDDFEIGAIENVTTGEALAMRDETGRPLWAGRGRWGQ